VEPLDQEGSAAFIKGRLAASGARKDIFTPEALGEIFVYSKGIPRRINRVSDLALLTAFGLEKQSVDSEVMEAVIEELAQSPI
jgi:type II secretory pathway predicted ATPase ExeA